MSPTGMVPLPKTPSSSFRIIQKILFVNNHFPGTTFWCWKFQAFSGSLSGATAMWWRGNQWPLVSLLQSDLVSQLGQTIIWFRWARPGNYFNVVLPKRNDNLRFTILLFRLSNGRQYVRCGPFSWPIWRQMARKPGYSKLTTIFSSPHSFSATIKCNWNGHSHSTISISVILIN